MEGHTDYVSGGDMVEKSFRPTVRLLWLLVSATSQTRDGKQTLNKATNYTFMMSCSGVKSGSSSESILIKNALLHLLTHREITLVVV